MRILLITPDLPYPPVGGGKMRVHTLLKQLAERHHVTVVGFDREPQTPGRADALRQICAEVVPVPLAAHQTRAAKRKQQLLSLVRPEPYQHTAFYSHQMQQMIDHYLRTQSFDIVQVEFAQMAYYNLHDYSRCVLDQHNVEYELLQRVYQNTRPSLRKLYSFAEWWKFSRAEVRACQQFATVLTTSERDRSVLAAQAPNTHLEVIPNGVDCNYFTNPQRTSDDDLILFTGTIDYFPNTDGLTYFLEEILPLVRREIPQVRFCIAGKNPPAEIQRYANQPGVTITGYLEDIRSVFPAASVVVAPLRIGGGTRLKILEAMAMRKAVVATSIGAEGISVTSGEHLLLADDPVAFARAVVTLLRDRNQREQIAEAGRKQAERYYDWQSIVARLEQVYMATLERASGSLAYQPAMYP